MSWSTPLAEDEYSPFVKPARNGAAAPPRRIESPFVEQFDPWRAEDEGPDAVIPLDEAGAHPTCTKSGIGIHGQDDRQPVSDTTAIPSRWICQLWVRQRDSNGAVTVSGATGVLVSPRHVLTVAHAIRSAEPDARNQLVTKEAIAIRVTPGRDGSDRPFDTVDASPNARLAPGWSARTMRADHDYALLTLDSPIGDRAFPRLGGARLCYWGATSCGHKAIAKRVPPESLQGATAFTSGYPKDRGNGESPIHTSGVLSGVVATNRIMSYTADACQGQSGSPVWVEVGGERRLVGLVVKVLPRTTLVLRVTRELSRQLRAWLGRDSEAFLGEVAATGGGGGGARETEWEHEGFGETAEDERGGAWVDAPAPCPCRRMSEAAAPVAPAELTPLLPQPAWEDAEAGEATAPAEEHDVLEAEVDLGEGPDAAWTESMAPDATEDAWAPEQYVPPAVTKLRVLPFMTGLSGPLNPGFYGPGGAYRTDPALQALVRKVGELKEARGVQLALVDLTKGTASPAFAGVAFTQQTAIASTGKLAVLYAALQLRAQLRARMTTGGHATPADAFVAQRTAWLATQTPPPGATVTAVAGDLGRRGDLMTWKGSPIYVVDGALPDLNTICNATATPIELASRPLSYVAGSTTACDELLVLSQAMVHGRGDDRTRAFRQRMRSMIGLSDDRATASCIDDLGSCYIAALMIESGLWHPARGGGIWLAGNYIGRQWQRGPIPGVFQNGTAGAMAALLTLLARDQLVDAASSAEMRALMAKDTYPGAATNSPIRATLAASGRTSTVWSKLGWLKAEQKLSDVAIVRRTESGRTLHYVAIILNASDKGDSFSKIALGLDDCIRRHNGLP